MAQSEHLTSDVKKAAQQAHHVDRAEKEPRAGVGIKEWTSERQKEKI